MSRRGETKNSHGNLGRRLDIVFLFAFPMSLVLSQIIGENHTILLKMMDKELNLRKIPKDVEAYNILYSYHVVR